MDNTPPGELHNFSRSYLKKVESDDIFYLLFFYSGSLLPVSVADV